MSLPLSIPAQPGIMFRDPGYLAQVPLTSQTALEYFSLSPFFSRQSTNEVLRMQSIADAEGSSSRRHPRALEEALRRFKGTEYVLAHSNQPDLFIVHRRRRWGQGSDEVEVEQAYYIADGNILLAPDLYTLLGNRLLTTLSALHDSLSYAHGALPAFDPRSGVAWRLAAAESSGAGAGAGAGAAAGQAAAESEEDDESDSDDEERHGAAVQRDLGNERGGIKIREEGKDGVEEAMRGQGEETSSGRGKRKSSMSGIFETGTGDGGNAGEAGQVGSGGETMEPGGSEVGKRRRVG